MLLAANSYRMDLKAHSTGKKLELETLQVLWASDVTDLRKESFATVLIAHSLTTL